MAVVGNRVSVRGADDVGADSALMSANLGLIFLPHKGVEYKVIREAHGGHGSYQRRKTKSCHLWWLVTLNEHFIQDLTTGDEAGVDGQISQGGFAGRNRQISKFHC